MNVADDALAGRHADGEAMRDRMARLVLRNRRIDRLDELAVGYGAAVPKWPNLAYGPNVHRRAIVGINHVAAVQPLER